MNRLRFSASTVNYKLLALWCVFKCVLCSSLNIATTAVVFFPEETKYSIVALTLIKETNPQVGDFVHVKEQGKTHDAKLVKTGKYSMLYNNY